MQPKSYLSISAKSKKRKYKPTPKLPRVKSYPFRHTSNSILFPHSTFFFISISQFFLSDRQWQLHFTVFQSSLQLQLLLLLTIGPNPTPTATNCPSQTPIGSPRYSVGHPIRTTFSNPPPLPPATPTPTRFTRKRIGPGPSSNPGISPRRRQNS